MSVSCADKWRAEWNRREEGLREVSTWDRFKDWNRNRMPESSVEIELDMALGILLGQGDILLAKFFLNRALDLASRATAENKVENELCKNAFPLNRGGLMRARTYASCLLLSTPLEEGVLSQASGDFYQWALYADRPYWDHQTQAYATAAFRLALVAGNRALAQEQLKTRKSFKWHAQEHAILKRIATAEPGTLGGEDLAQLDAYFNIVRDPTFKADVFHETHIVRLEMSLIRYRYFVSRDGSIDWSVVLEQIRA